MKRTICLALALLLACACAAAERVPYGIMMVDNCREWVSLREAPDRGSRRLAKVPLYALVTDAEWTDGCGDFLFCDYDGQTGYILSEYLTPWADPEPEEGEVSFRSDLGFSFYYSPALMRVDPYASEDGHSLLVEPADGQDVEDAVYLEILTPESTGRTPADYLRENAPEGTKYEEDGTEYGGTLRWFRRPYAHNPEIMETVYAAEDGANGVSAVAVWPAEDGGAWEELFTELLRSLRFHGDELLSAGWAEEAAVALVLDEDGESVALSAKERVTDVALLSLELSGGDGALFDAEVLAERAEILPGAPLVVKIAFPGDIPNYGVRVTDGDGKVRQYAISLSGRDGSLELMEF